MIHRDNYIIPLTNKFYEFTNKYNKFLANFEGDVKSVKKMNFHEFL